MNLMPNVSEKLLKLIRADKIWRYDKRQKLLLTKTVNEGKLQNEFSGTCGMENIFDIFNHSLTRVKCKRHVQTTSNWCQFTKNVEKKHKRKWRDPICRTKLFFSSHFSFVNFPFSSFSQRCWALSILQFNPPESLFWNHNRELNHEGMFCIQSTFSRERKRKEGKVQCRLVSHTLKFKVEWTAEVLGLILSARTFNWIKTQHTRNNFAWNCESVLNEISGNSVLFSRVFWKFQLNCR